jgi:hypothetical protein
MFGSDSKQDVKGIAGEFGAESPPGLYQSMMADYARNW